MLNTNKSTKIISYVGLILWMLVNLFPVYWMFTFSLKNNEEIFGKNVAGLPQHWLWSNYTEAMKTGHMGRYFLNSGIVAVSTILITLAVALMATFALTRMIWKRRKTMNKFFMLGLTIPIHASIVPIYVTLSRMHLLNTRWALIIPYACEFLNFVTGNKCRSVLPAGMIPSWAGPGTGPPVPLPSGCHRERKEPSSAADPLPSPLPAAGRGPGSG